MISENCLPKSVSESPLERRENDFSRSPGFTFICFFFLSTTLTNFTGLLIFGIILVVCLYYTNETILDSKISLIELVSVRSPNEIGILSVIKQSSLLVLSSDRYLASSSLLTWSINSVSFILKNDDFW